ncbi:MAG: FtsB family cell division protein [Micromonosporaceae bacterium]
MRIRASRAEVDGLWILGSQLTAQDGNDAQAGAGTATGAGAAPSRRPGRAGRRLTSRAAILAVVLCAIALSLAYPVREYIAQRRQIYQLETQHRMAQAQVRRLEAEQRRLNDPKYIEDQARARLNMCMPGETCYVIINGHTAGALPKPPPARRAPWYVTLWKSVQQADHRAAR